MQYGPIFDTTVQAIGWTSCRPSDRTVREKGSNTEGERGPRGTTENGLNALSAKSTSVVLRGSRSCSVFIIAMTPFIRLP